MNTMKYKSYIGSIEVDTEDNVIYGKLMHIRDLVNYEAETPQDLRAAFESAVDDYLADCERDGVSPDVPFKGSFNVRVTPELHRELAITAKSRGSNLNEYISLVLLQHKERSLADRVASISDDQWIQVVKFTNRNALNSSQFAKYFGGEVPGNKARGAAAAHEHYAARKSKPKEEKSFVLQTHIAARSVQ